MTSDGAMAPAGREPPDEGDDGRPKLGKWREVPLDTHATAALALPDSLASVHKDTVSDWFRDDATAAGVGAFNQLRY